LIHITAFGENINITIWCETGSELGLYRRLPVGKFRFIKRKINAELILHLITIRDRAYEPVGMFTDAGKMPGVQT
jgi:hypothetical protein